MKNKGQLLFSLFIVFCASSYSLSGSSPQKTDPWKKWLDEVHLIITRTEKAVFNSLQTEEDRKRFQVQFWKARDPTPETPINEYRIEFSRRLKYADTQLEGPNSDRGRIYILLGEPNEKQNFEGYEDVVDCELWIYMAEGRPGLPPFLNLLFYRPKDFGNYRQFHPGLHSASDILSPGYTLSLNSRLEAYNHIKRFNPELAQATLSIIPGEGDPFIGQSLSSSGSVIAQIHSLPERELEKNYLKNFTAVEGTVDVNYSAKEIGGKGLISLSENRGFRFLNYSIMPDAIEMEKSADNLHTADISINLRIEDLGGKTIHQQERNITLRLNDAQKKAMVEERKIAFKDFAPLVEGTYNVSIIFSNKTKEGFFVYREKITIDEDTIPVLTGYKIKEIDSNNFVPFSAEGYKILSDTRTIFNKNESLEGLILTEQRPNIYLTSIEGKDNSIEITDIEKQGRLFLFRQPLANIPSDSYYLIIRNEQGEIYKKIIAVMPFQVEKPVDIERSEVSSSEHDYIFVLGQQYLNKEEVDTAIQYFNKLPDKMWDSKILPVIARAYYIKKNYEKVTELLETEKVIKNYPVLLLLANSNFELNRNQKAAEYFERLRSYGDTASLNKTLGTIYNSLGESKKAEAYWERARKLEEIQKKDPKFNKER